MAPPPKSSSDIRIYPDKESLFAATAEFIATELENALEQRQWASFVLTGGNTPRPVYELLCGSPLRERIAWGRIRLFWGDERCVAADHPDSNFRMAHETLLSELPLSEDYIHRMRGELENHEEAALSYEKGLLQIFGGAPVPRFDLVLLGMGDDGHTASLFPGTRWEEDRLVVANYVPKFGAWRITMTPRLLNSARTVIFLTAGPGKATALARVLEGPAGTYPAQSIQPVNGSVTWMVDEAAASQLKSSTRHAVASGSNDLPDGS